MSIINGLKMWLGFPAESRVISVSPFVGLGLGMAGALALVWQGRQTLADCCNFRVGADKRDATCTSELERRASRQRERRG